MKPMAYSASKVATTSTTSDGPTTAAPKSPQPPSSGDQDSFVQIGVPAMQLVEKLRKERSS